MYSAMVPIVLVYGLAIKLKFQKSSENQFVSVAYNSLKNKNPTHMLKFGKTYLFKQTSKEDK